MQAHRAQPFPRADQHQPWLPVIPRQTTPSAISPSCIQHGHGCASNLSSGPLQKLWAAGVPTTSQCPGAAAPKSCPPREAPLCSLPASQNEWQGSSLGNFSGAGKQREILQRGHQQDTAAGPRKQRSGRAHSSTTSPRGSESFGTRMCHLQRDSDVCLAPQGEQEMAGCLQEPP